MSMTAKLPGVSEDEGEEAAAAVAEDEVGTKSASVAVDADDAAASDADADEAPVVRKKKKKKKLVESAPADDTSSVSKLSVHSWKAGVAGLVVLLSLAYYAMRHKVMENGWGITSSPPDKNLAMAFVLLVVAMVMLAFELGIRIKVEGQAMLSVREDVKAGRYGAYVRECLLVYLTELGIFQFAILIYEWTGEYHFQRGPDYYKPWFAILHTIRNIYLYGGLPYVFFTRALQHDPKADKKQLAFTVMKSLRWLGNKLRPNLVDPAGEFGSGDGSAVLGFFVKLFFVPLMTVFFADQFGTLVKNYDFVFNHVLTSDHPQIGTHDFYNVMLSLIFAIDVGLAWGGYVVTSRWIKNTMWSVEPTLAGWAVAVLCYPPLNRVPGFYFQNPGDHAFLQMQEPRLVSLFAAMSLTSFAVYTAATVCFGLRFSNLTHRGIITTGPYSWIRHPAYASKNFSWWCVMLPVAIMQSKTEGIATTLINIVGLITLTGQYALRALTEERHLMKDPEYVAYMKKVPYRFIPGVL